MQSTLKEKKKIAKHWQTDHECPGCNATREPHLVLVCILAALGRKPGTQPRPVRQERRVENNTADSHIRYTAYRSFIPKKFIKLTPA